MRKIFIFFVLVCCPFVALSSSVKNISDKCSCFSLDDRPWNIGHCEVFATLRLSGVYQDASGNSLLLQQPGESTEAPVIKVGEYNMVGLRAPGPKQYSVGGGEYYSPVLPDVYAVPVYVRLVTSTGAWYYGVELTMLTTNQIDLATCTYHPGKVINSHYSANGTVIRVESR